VEQAEGKKDEVSFRVKKEDSKEIIQKETKPIEEEVYETKEVLEEDIEEDV